MILGADDHHRCQWRNGNCMCYGHSTWFSVLGHDGHEGQAHVRPVSHFATTTYPRLPAPAGRVGGALGLLGAGLGLAPALRAALIGRRLPAQLAAAFGDAPPRGGPGAPPRLAPLVAADLLRGVTSPRVRRSRRIYAMRDGQSLSLDLYQPAQAAGAAPGVLVVHGGSWERGDSTQLPALNRYVAARGYIVAAINYRLLPTHPFPAARDDVLAALSYLKGNAAAIGLGPTRIVLLGRSAGGQLALLVAYTAGDPAIRGAIGFYPATDP